MGTRAGLVGVPLATSATPEDCASLRGCDYELRSGGVRFLCALSFDLLGVITSFPKTGRQR